MREEREYANYDLERKVLAYFIRSDYTIPIKLDYFTIEEGRNLFRFALDNKGLACDFDEWWDIWELELQRTNKSIEPHRKFLQSLWSEDLDEGKIEYYLTQLKGFAEARELLWVYDTSLTQYREGNVVEARQVLEDGISRLKREFSHEVVSRGEYASEFIARYMAYKKKKAGKYISKIPTGIRKLDKKIDGTARSSLNFFQGESSIGKTFLLQEVAYQGMMNAFCILFITVEMQRIEIETRWDSRLTGAKYRDVDQGLLSSKEEGWWRKRIRDLKEPYRRGGRLATSYIPEGCTVSSLEAEVDYWELQWGKKIDVLVVDYADLLESRRRAQNEQESQGNVFRDLKRLSQTRDLVVWTASQVAGISYGRIRLGLKDTGYSKKKAHWANLVIGVGADEDDREAGILRLWIAKNTFGRRDFEIILYTDFEIAKIDVEGEEE